MKLVAVDYISELPADEDYKKIINNLSKELEKKPTVELFLQRGDMYKKLQSFGKALGDYKKALMLETDNQVAITKIAMIENILSIENTFYHENAYTDGELFPEV